MRRATTLLITVFVLFGVVLPSYAAPTAPPNRPTVQQASSVYDIPPHRRLAYVDDSSGNSEIMVMDIEGGQAFNLTNSPSRDEYPSWTVGGDQIVFQSDRDGQFQLYVMNADGSEVRLLTGDTNGAVTPRVGPDGRIAYAEHTTGNTFEIAIMDADGSNRRLVTNHGAESSYPTWSPDQQTLAYQTDWDISNFYQIYVIDSDGTNPRRPYGVSPLRGQRPMFTPTSALLLHESYPFSSSDNITISLCDALNARSCDRLNEDFNDRRDAVEATATTNYNETLVVYSQSDADGLQLVVADFGANRYGDLEATNHRFITSGSGRRYGAAMPFYDVAPVFVANIDGEPLNMEGGSVAAYEVNSYSKQLNVGIPGDWRGALAENGLTMLTDNTGSLVGFIPTLKWGVELGLEEGASDEEALAAYLGAFGLSAASEVQTIQFEGRTFYALTVQSNAGDQITMVFVPLEQAYSAIITDRFPDPDVIRIAATMERTNFSLALESELEVINNRRDTLEGVYEAALAGYRFNYDDTEWEVANEAGQDGLGQLAQGIGELLFPGVFLNSTRNDDASIAIFIPAIDDPLFNSAFAGASQISMALVQATISGPRTDYYQYNGRFMQVITGSSRGDIVRMVLTALEDGRPVTILAYNVYVDRDLMAIAASATSQP